MANLQQGFVSELALLLPKRRPTRPWGAVRLMLAFQVQVIILQFLLHDLLNSDYTHDEQIEKHTKNCIESSVSVPILISDSCYQAAKIYDTV